MRGILPRLTTDTTCVAALEFALLAPTFVMVFAGVVDIGNALYTWSRLEAALAVGTNYAQVNNNQVSSTNGATLASNIASLVSTSNTGAPATVTVVVNNGPSETATPVHHADGTYTVTYAAGGTAANADNCYCPTGSPANWTWGSSVTCGNTCSGTSNTAGKFVTVTASYNFTPFFTSYGFVTNGAMTGGSAVQTR